MNEIHSFTCGNITVSGTDRELLDLVHILWNTTEQDYVLSDMKEFKDLAYEIAYEFCGK